MVTVWEQMEVAGVHLGIIRANSLDNTWTWA